VSLSGGSFEVHLSQHILQSIYALQRRATLAGRGDEMVEAFRIVLSRLETDPRSLGEPTYRLPALRMQIRCAVVPPLIIHFGVCEDRATVYVKGVESLGE